ncbi:unnamed protein product [Darwinula stevensoni]|uniref:Protein Wnt n=1 Tax=Darwinula stevensoni TaxID=69355 RepID=A0A7R8X1Y0_9CRUS|nr:unnamed protein product [Darwinula stevensoni]CAG0882679.1 unnamed protein product [Darwinula stevensoni]
MREDLLLPFPLVFFSFFHLGQASFTPGSWLNLGMQGYQVLENGVEVKAIGMQPVCTRIPGLSRGQARLCQLYQDHMSHVGRGARTGISECQHQFQYRRWNCSTVHDSSVFGPLLQIASPEAAFAHAIAASGVVHAVSRACRDGELSTCTCSRARRPMDLNTDWIWGGCGDNIEYGYKFAQEFVDVREKEKKHDKGSHEQGRVLMNLHNNEAGRRAVVKKTKVTCKCHGVSGSCSLITCWQQLASFREIGDYLKDKYDGATKVKVNRRGKLQVADPTFSIPTAYDLVYMDDPPDYCHKNDTIGAFGTEGRGCNRTSLGTDGCDILCCGRGYNTRQIYLEERCKCKFHWCCYVECKTCRRQVSIHTCK